MTQTPVPHHAEDDQQQQPAAAAATGERRAAVRVGIALASLLFMVAAGVLYLRWATMREPMCVFIVEAPTTLRGAEVTVDAINMPKPHTVTIGRGERFAIPFYLDYGTYKVSVTMDGASVVETEVTLDHNRPYQKIDLNDVPPPPASTGTTRSSSPSFDIDPLRGLISPSPGGSGAP